MPATLGKKRSKPTKPVRKRTIRPEGSKFLLTPDSLLWLPNGSPAILQVARCGDCMPLVLAAEEGRSPAVLDYTPSDAGAEPEYCKVGCGPCVHRGCLIRAERIAKENRVSSSYDRATMVLREHDDDPRAHGGGYRSPAYDPGGMKCPICADARGFVLALLQGDFLHVGEHAERLRWWSTEHSSRAGATFAGWSDAARLERQARGKRVTKNETEMGRVKAAAFEKGGSEAVEAATDPEKPKRARANENAARGVSPSPKRRNTCEGPGCNKKLTGRQQRFHNEACKQRWHRQAKKTGAEP